MSDKSNGHIWLIAIVIFALVTCLQLISGNSTSDSSPPAREDSAERRYVEGKFRREGYSAKDSATAADAVLRFHRAQEARKNR